MKTHKTESTGTSCCFAGGASSGGLFLGGGLMIMGAAFLLERLALLGEYSAWQMWPVLLLWAAIIDFSGMGQCRSVVGGIIKLLLGCLFLAGEMGYMALSWSVVWPVLLIIFGVVVFSGSFWARFRMKKKPAGFREPGVYEASLFMSGHEEEVHDDAFERAEISCVMGGLKLDMRTVTMKGEEAEFHVDLRLAGIELFVPQHWEVVSRLAPVMGAFENKTRYLPSEAKKMRLIVSGNLMMSGIEVKN